ncbi:hypothetical protein [Roseisolibacter sp. H3M3-2]|uniref:hypothetical protein n=1 Tax=Roseisolibacter sp. H3M3-2 TaxID=3031323 RepID=UPI0023DC6076|nr:hypothetical protein [Roseisolibacter sp. H3M3-2]MDF1504783.1 hypothetical protein [Roseisolibacter sp. H3M3-2]
MRARPAAAGALLLLVGCGSDPAAPPAEAPPPPTTPAVYEVGRAYLGREGYVEYRPGDAPVILTATHGGALAPAEIPDRTAARCGGEATTATDLNTVALALATRERYRARFGRTPHVVLVHLARRKLDANRPAGEAACGDAAAGRALAEWHAFVDEARRAVTAASGRGLLLDLHGHAHAVPRLELGYLLDGAQLDASDAALDADAGLEDASSVRELSRAAPASFAALLRGSAALGTLYARQGVPAVPSASDPSPRGAPYFSGGETTRRHGCAAGGTVCAVQVEAPLAGVRDDAASRDRFGDATSAALEEFLRTHWGLRLAAGAGAR